MSGEVDFIFIGSGEMSFLLSSLKDMLEKRGLVTEKCDANLKSFQSMLVYPKLFLVDAETLLKNAEARVYLYDKCIEQNRKIVLIGDSNAISDLYDVTVNNVIAESFIRPINNHDVADRLQALIAQIDEKGTKENILIVDDSPAFLRLISEWLEGDYNVKVCPSATAAFHMIETSKPDLILLDYEMPICNGGQFLQMLRSEEVTADIPVMFFTSKDDADTVKSLISLKPQGYLLKNQTKDNILHSLEKFFLKEKIK